MEAIDTSILVCAFDTGSHMHNQASAFLEGKLKEGKLGIAESSLLQFYAMITNARHVQSVMAPTKAAHIVNDIYNSPSFLVCRPDEHTFQNFLAQVENKGIVGNEIFVLKIAQTLLQNGFNKVFTVNAGAYAKFHFIQAADPFSDVAASQRPIQTRVIPYGRQCIDEEDITAVCSVLRSDWLTTGPNVEEFENKVGSFVGAQHAVAFSSGTAALHGAMFALGIGPGDEVIVPPITFAATANCILYQGGRPVFADIEPDTLLIDYAQVAAKITGRTKAIIGVDYAGQPCNWDALRNIANRHGLALVADACHALGAEYNGKKVGTLADMTTFSFHPVKHITTGEGGMVVTDDPKLAGRMRSFRNHGITTEHRQREARGSWLYEMMHLGYNYRITDFQCALGMSQLRKLPGWVARRQEIARRYNLAFSELAAVKPSAVRGDVSHSYHLYVIQLDPAQLRATRGEIFSALRAGGIGVNVHYIPIYWHPYYRELGYAHGLCPHAEAAYERLLSLPMFSTLTDKDVNDVIAGVTNVVKAYSF